jgi:hypothetical protein
MSILTRLFLVTNLIFIQCGYAEVLPNNLVKNEEPVYDITNLLKQFGGKLKRKDIGVPLYTTEDKILNFGIKFECINYVALTEATQFLDLDNCAAILTVKYRFDIMNF